MEPSGITALLIEYRYLILIPLAIFEGQMIGFIAGMLSALGYFNPFIVYMILILGDVLPDFVYYAIGRFGDKRRLLEKYGPAIRITPERIDILRMQWFRHPMRTMAITKLAYGLSTPLLVTAGLVRLPFRTFWTRSVPLSFLQHAVFLSLGYFFGSYYTVVESTSSRIQLAIAAVAVVGFAYYFFASSIKRKFLSKQDA
ncbi:MAG TPA: hypothetical protein VD928_00055 [Candidatus Paceibacterota bacterium]|nr:hypothetical protein [Candidatus Paceibacterota bacterium]